MKRQERRATFQHRPSCGASAQKQLPGVLADTTTVGTREVRRSLRRLGHAAAGLHLLQSLIEVAVVGLQLVRLVQCRPQLRRGRGQMDQCGSSFQGANRYFQFVFFLNTCITTFL